jgi:microcystin-dependent protein
MGPTAVDFTGAGGSHLNMMQTIAINYIICLVGDYPSHS